MTKRLVIALLCLIGALTVCVASLCYLNGVMQGLYGQIELTEQTLEAGNSTVECAYRTYEAWQKVKMPVGALLKHTDVDQLDTLFGLMLDYAKQNNTDELNETLTQLKVAVSVIRKGEMPVLDNIF